MRNTAFLWFVLAIFCSGALFYVSQRTYDMKQDLSFITKDISQEKEALRVLEAEWSYLNNPKRLERLAKKYLKTDVMKLDQFIKEESVKLAVSYVVKPIETVVAINNRVIKVKAKNLELAKAVVEQHKEREFKTVSIATNKIHSFRQLIRVWGNE